jgi:SAM-dependent methyltransferase
MSYEVTQKFWRGLQKYPNYPHLFERRLVDLSFVLGFADGAESILDLGCGDGTLLILLRELSTIKEFHGVDLSETLLGKINARWGDCGSLHLYFTDALILEEFPGTDITTCLGMFPYIFDDQDLYKIISKVRSRTLIVRTPCTLKDEDEYINKFSDDLNANYSAVYRTLVFYKTMLSKIFDVKIISRSYPDEIEGKYGTKHFFFVCEK